MSRPRWGDFVSLVATGLRGLRSRRLLTAGSVLLASIAIGAAVVGPMYQAGSAASFLITKLRATPVPFTGFTVDYTPASPQDPATAVHRSVGGIGSLLAHYGRPRFSVWSTPLDMTSPRFAALKAKAVLVSQPGACSTLVVVAGRCPSGPNQMLLLQADASQTDTKVGDQITVTGVPHPMNVVGLYRLRLGGRGLYDKSRFVSVPPQPTQGLGMTPYYPAPFVMGSPRALTNLAVGTWFVRVDRRLLIPADTTVADLTASIRELSKAHDLLSTRPTGSYRIEAGNALRALVAEFHKREVTAKQTVTPAVVSLILVAMVLLTRLLAAWMDLRRPELALAGLRGISRPRMWLLGLLEPVLMLLIAAPIGLLLGYLAARELAAVWLVPGLPQPLDLPSVGFALVVLVVALAVAAGVVRAALAEPLNAQIAGVRRPSKPGRWPLLLRLVLIAAAAAVLAATLFGRRQSQPAATDLMLPILLAVVAGMLTSVLATLVARWWAGRSARGRGVTGYLAAHTIARRREGTLVVLPLTAALGIAVFAAGIYTSAADWRASDAATQVGAAVRYPVKLSLSQAVALTHQLDPQGRWLMAAGADFDAGNGAKLIVDAPRLARVAAWPGWSPGESVTAIQQAIAPTEPSLMIRGRRLQVTMVNRVGGNRGQPLLLDVAVTTAAGHPASVLVGPYPPGRSTRRASIHMCAQPCLVTGLQLSGPATIATAMQGSVSIGEVRVDGAQLRYFDRVGWHPYISSDYGPPSVRSVRVTRSTVKVTMNSRGLPAIAVVGPSDVPLVLPVAMGRTATPTVVRRRGGVLTLRTASLTNVRVRPVATLESMPFFGPTGILVDYTMYSRENEIFAGDTVTSILARADTPTPILNKLAAHGVSGRITLASVEGVLNEDAYALALNLYLVVTVLVIVLALAGLGANQAVQLPGRRRDAASLRVVGIRRRSIILAAAAEFASVLGAAAVAGILAGALAQYVVVRTLVLGYSDSVVTPRVLPALDATSLVLLLAATFAVLLCIATALGALTVRGARTETLRENAT